ncbi:MAG: glycine zipper 2TM domain-containing protein [Burkholderiaceae bacterium]
MRSLALVSGLVAVSLVVSGCATRSSSPDIYRSGETQVEQKLRAGVVESIRGVTIQRDSTGAGVIAGGVVGGVAGSGVGDGRGSTIAGVLGAIGGAVLGQAIEERANQRAGFEIIVRLDSGEKRAIVQEADVSFRPGDRVRLIGSGSTVRVVPY